MNTQFWFILGKTKVYIKGVNLNGLVRAQRARNARNCASKFQTKFIERVGISGGSLVMKINEIALYFTG